MNDRKTLIIFDWDDTLFPTFWTIQNNINLIDKKVQNQYIVFFAKLDTILYQILTKLLNYGNVAIVTNAGSKWIMVSSCMLPNTQKILRDKILILSARDAYQNKYPDQMHLWKKKVFRNIVAEHFKDHNLQNIISIGDAEYEFTALTDLYNHNSVIKKRLLKTIRFKKEPSFDDLMDQLEVFNECAIKIVLNSDHMDLKFENK